MVEGYWIDDVVVVFDVENNVKRTRKLEIVKKKKCLVG